jgi:hypothetical protein
VIRGAAAVLACLLAGTAVAQDGSIRPLWLSDDAEIGALPTDHPVGPPPSEEPRLALGELLFRAPSILGGEARRAGLACESCHSNGGANTSFFVPGLSGTPGTIDVTHAAWNPANDDGAANPLRIPPLWNLARTAPYGHRGQFSDLAAFTRHVIVDEFAGTEPPAALLDALVAYLASLPAPANRNVDASGRLTRVASADAGRGREAFDKGCAGCHRYAEDFQDGKVHRLRGGSFATPSLRGIGVLGRFFHDGRSDDLPAAIASHAGELGITHGAETGRWIAAYVGAVGAVDAPDREPVTLAQDLDRFQRMVRLLPRASEAAEVTAEIARMLQDEVGRVHRRFPLEAQTAAQDVLIDWANALREIARAAEAGEATSPGWNALLGRIGSERAVVEVAAPTSLYDPATLAAWKASRRAR